ncbi:pyocin R2, holin [Stutzerimonas chloritidismutans]|uniref:phage holin family protein n=1 Tax=Stutzerimonas chloritidismutans TaxID=203192 RepID=UPI003F17B8FC
MSTEQQMQQSLADLPAWMLILVALAGLTGEMWRAEAAGVAVGVLVKRVLLRFGSSALFGVSMLMFVYWLKQDYLLAGAMGIAVGLIGADISGGIYSRYLAKKAGVCNVERQG